MEIAPPAPLADVLGAAAGRAVLLDPDPALPRLLRALPRSGPVVLVVGPEGGFTDEEIAAARRAGAAAASLGPCVLRVETAAVVAAGVALAAFPEDDRA
jgi:16S rRNA (uracil1498-N3)-methyltransferase